MDGKKKLFITCALLLAASTFFYACSAPPFAGVKNLYSAQGKNLICFGDSLTEGRGAPEGSDYPSLLGKELNAPVINSGISGDTTAGGLARIDNDVLAKDPKIVIIELGANDFIRSGINSKTVDDAFSNLDQIVDLVQNRGAVAVVAGIDINADIARRYQELARKKGAVYVPDILGGIDDRPELMADSFHPNAHGYRKMAEKFLAVLKPLLKEMD
ncbi:MAG TPA: GDSL-type esterase/lipase family protein [Candidatus Omnitrophota bacterium]|nr:GDSL-type esterase/lipase family protein [Candidatus Omnitrophota bacterium]